MLSHSLPEPAIPYDGQGRIATNGKTKEHRGGNICFLDRGSCVVMSTTVGPVERCCATGSGGEDRAPARATVTQA
eukprot:CAMPEP_0185556880 /NCGR_PEP_ID=MMETSP1381-20130426/48347_1 /TAXON_ID=298111 /ORGANISM="Pavlova sp., Strain CCMP459" /LENGTH=74 /DNA_ID=CAMNT_0028170291 /DNA_START=300 /DNA_END=525 /DNA_ORIENTATION=+